MIAALMMICQCQWVTNLRWKEKIRINLRPQYKASLYLSLTKKSSNQIIEWRLELMSQGFQLPLLWWKQLDDGSDDFLETKISWKLRRRTEVFFLWDVFMGVSRFISGNKNKYSNLYVTAYPLQNLWADTTSTWGETGERASQPKARLQK